MADPHATPPSMTDLRNLRDCETDLAAALARETALREALTIQPAQHSWPDGKFCSDGCPACAKAAALAFAGDPATTETEARFPISEHQESCYRPASVSATTEEPAGGTDE